LKGDGDEALDGAVETDLRVAERYRSAKDFESAGEPLIYPRFPWCGVATKAGLPGWIDSALP